MVYVGLDYHSESIRVCVLSESGEQLANRNVPNSVAAVQDLVACHGYPKGIAIEACCGAADFAEELAQVAEWDVRLAHPGYVRRLKQSPDKSDHDDAYLLADLVRVNYLPEVWLADAKTRELRRFVRYRQQLKRSRTNLKLQITALLREERVPQASANTWTKAWEEEVRSSEHWSAAARWIIARQFERLAELDQEIRLIEQRLEEATREDPLTRQLMEEPGIGLVTAVTLRAEIGTFDRFRTGKQLARFCGVTPCNASSGKRQADAGLIRACNRELRTVLIETAHRLVQRNAKWRDLKTRLRKTKPGSVATAAVANRWVRWLFHQIRHPGASEPGVESAGLESAGLESVV
jgi:transposase